MSEQDDLGKKIEELKGSYRDGSASRDEVDSLKEENRILRKKLKQFNTMRLY